MSGAIAVVGAALRLPRGIATVADLGAFLDAGGLAVGPVPPERWDPATFGVPGNFLEDPLRFDAGFFGLSPREAAETDPAQRILLELAWTALEDAELPPDGLAGTRTGVYVGLALSDWGRRHLLGADPARIGPWSGTGTFLSVAAGRIAYTLGLRGPALAVDTACSSSLVAVHLAVQALRAGEIDLALAGGASLMWSPLPGIWLRKVGAASPDGRSRTFDAAAAGYGRGEGAGLVVLKRLADALADGDPIAGVIRGTAVNQDGRTSGLTAPSGAAQQAVLRAALADAGAAPADVACVEAHGTATPLGDAVEAEALRAVFGDGLPVGAVKANLGHTETAAGVVGLAKALWIARVRRTPPQVGLESPNPRVGALRLGAGPVGPGLVGVSSFGMAGTNAHVLVEGPPARPPAAEGPATVLLSAPSPERLRALARAYAEAEGPLPALASAAARRATFRFRAAVSASDLAGLRAGLAAVRDGAEAPRHPEGEPPADPAAAWLAGFPVAVPRATGGRLPPTPLGGERHGSAEVEAAHTGDLVRDALRGALGLPADAPLDEEAPFFALGLDSVGATELRARLARALGRDLPASVAFDFPTVARLRAFLLGLAPARPEPAPASGGALAVVGASVRLPGGVRTLEALWDALLRGPELAGPPPRFDGRGLPAGGRGFYLEGAEDFAADALGVPDREALRLDPQQRLLLEEARRALEDAGVAPGAEDDGPTGVYVGVEPSGYGDRWADDPTALAGSRPSAASGRISHVFGLRGPSVTVDTACSSGLVALAAAVRDLRAGVCRRAVVAAVHVMADGAATRALAGLGALAADGVPRPFDAAAGGYVRGEGCVALVLEPAVPGDPRALALVRGVAVNHDGPGAGFTVPSGPAQEAAVRAALADAGADPAEVAFVAAHGTGTPLGDPIEAGALHRVVPGAWLGAAKAVFGHSEAASGLVNLLAAALALRAGVAPPIARLARPNPDLPPVRLPTRPEPLRGRFAGASAFGLTGTNAHAVLEAPGPAAAAEESAGPWVLPVSAPDADAARALGQALAGAVGEAALDDVAHTLARGRAALRWRAAAVAGGVDEAVLGLARLAPAPAGDGRVAFVVGPVGVPRAFAAADPAFAAALARLAPDPEPAPAAEGLATTLALARAWEARGVRPAAVIALPGGEGAAEVLSGARSAEEALRSARRGAPSSATTDPAARLRDAGVAVALALGPAPEGLGAIPCAPPGLSPARALAEAAAALWAAGVDAALPDPRGRRIRLPTTPLPARRFWPDPPLPPAWREVWEPAAPALDPTRPPPRLVGDGGLRARLRPLAEGPGDAATDTLVALALDPPAGPVPEAARRLFLAVVEAVRAAPGGVVLVTRGADRDPVQAPLAGLAVTLAAERAGAAFVHVDLDPDAPLDDQLPLLALARGPAEAALRIRGGALEVRRLVAGPAPALRALRGPTLVTGGTGAVGGRLARWLEAHGAGPVHAISRRTGADLSTPEGVARALAALPERPRTVVHAAGVACDAPLAAIDADLVARGFAPKVDAAWALAEALPEATFVWVSSAAARLGSPGQAVYAGANAFLDALAARRPGDVALAYGPWAGPGMAAGGARPGVRPLDPEAAAGAVAAASSALLLDLDGPAWARALPRVPSAAAALAGPPPAPDAGDAVREAVREVLGAADPDPDAPFGALGMDSILALALGRRLRERTGRELPLTVAFDHPTVRRLEAFLRAPATPPAAPAPARPAAPVAASPARPATRAEPIALVGHALRMPGGANDPEAFWRLLLAGRDPTGPVPAARWAPGADGRSREAAFLDEAVVRGFEPEAFGLSDREAERLDPQQRLLLELAEEALERAGVAPDRVRGAPVGVFLGLGDSGFLDRFRAPGALRYTEPHDGTGNLPAFASGRIAHALGLRGPNLTLNTACSSALVALHLAARALRDGDADLALAGAAHLMLSPDHAVHLARLGALSPDGRTRAFDASAAGYGRGEGAGLFVLERLSDARRAGRPVLGVLLGSALGHDGASSGLTAPSGPAQAEVVRRALADAGLDPADVGFVEAHGSGTPLGDPIEIGALRTVFSPLPPIGAVKATVGHLEVAAGVASVAKVLGMLAHGVIPPHPHLRTPAPALGPVRIAARPEPWEGPRIAGVSGFGLSGTNVHLVLGPGDPAPPPAEADGPAVFVASARSREALGRLVREPLAGPWTDLAWSSWTTRAPRRFRAAATSPEALRDAVPAEAVSAPRVALLFSGQGSQFPGMGRALARFPEVRAVFEEAAARIDLSGWDDARVDDTRWTQPALFVLEVAIARWWLAQGVAPVAVLGHSVGHLAAAVVAGVLDLPDGLRLVEARARLLAALPRDGAMVALPVGEAAARRAIGGRPDVDVAAVNHPAQTVISGRREAVLAVAEALGGGVVLPVSHAFHSPLVEPVLAAFEAEVRGVTLRPPTLPVISNLHGGVADAAELADPAAWARLVRAPVAFEAGLRTLGGLGATALVEVGPGTALLGMAAATLGDAPVRIPTLRRGADAVEGALAAAGALFVHGVALDPRPLFPGGGRLVPLPPTPFVHRELWPADPEFPGSAAAAEDGAGWLVAEAWEPVAPGPAPADLDALPDGDPVAILTDLAARLRDGAPRVVVTREATAGNPAHAGVPGLLRAVRAEDPSRRLTWIDRVGGAPARGGPAGEDELRCGPEGVSARRLVRAAPPPAAPATLPAVLVTGGTRGVGLAVARDLLAAGAARVVLLGRSPLDPAVAAALADRPVTVVLGDVADPAAVAAALAPLAGGPHGVIHAAGVLADAALPGLDGPRFAAAWAPKVRGAELLDAAAPDAAFFVVFGAGAALVGSAGQGAYAAANEALAGVVARRRAGGRPALLVDWGAWAEIGMAARLDPALRARRAERGLGEIPPAVGVALLRRLLADDRPRLGVLPADWARVAAASPSPLLAALVPPGASAAPAATPGRVETVAELVARVLRHRGPLEPGRSLVEYGLDSLLAIELKNGLAALGLDVPVARVLAGPSLAELERLAAAARPAPAEAVPEARLSIPTHLAAFGLGVLFVVVAYVGTAVLVGFANP